MPRVVMGYPSPGRAASEENPYPTVASAAQAIEALQRRAGDAFQQFQEGPSIRPTTPQTFVPVVGPFWEALADIQDGDYGSAAFNGIMAAADALPVGVAVRGVKMANKGIGALKKGSTTANAARKQYRRRVGAGPDVELHHAVALNGIPRNIPNWRNHYMFLKLMPKDQHRRLTGSWKDGHQTLSKYGPLERAWYGTTDWMKAVPAGAAAYAADSVENLQDRSPSKGPPKR